MAPPVGPKAEEVEILNRRHILDTLAFEGMNERFDDIDEPHARTFEWIFEEESQEKPGSSYQAASVLREWLTSGDGVFHISGKLGSGKSTFMKHLYKDDRTKALLQKKTAGTKVVLSKFFFGQRGSQLQKSLSGLLRTLLHDTLQQCPELIPRVLPRQWQTICSSRDQLGPNFNLAELHTAFELMIQNHNFKEKRCFCLFIDALEEWDESIRYDFQDLTNFLLRVTKHESGSVKICVSSRPYKVFMRQFSVTQRLTIHHLTRSDMGKIMREDFERKAAALVPEAFISEIVNETLMKAEGSFLWVRLVVESVLNGLFHGDNTDDIRHKLDIIPCDLEYLYQGILRSLSPANSKLILVALAVISSLSRASEKAQLHPRYGMSLLAFSFLKDFMEDTRFALRLKDSHPMISSEQLPSRLKMAERIVEGRFRDLIETKRRHQSTQGESWPTTALQYDVAVIHHAVHYTVESHRSQVFTDTELTSLSTVGAVCQTTIAMVKSLSSPQVTGREDRSPGSLLFFDRELVSLFLLLRANRGEIEKHLESLDCLENELYQLRCSDCTSPTQIDPAALGRKTTIEYLPYFGCVHFDYAGLSLHHAAASFGLHEYAIRLLDGSCVWEIAALVDIAVDLIENSGDQELLSDGLDLLKAILSRCISADTISTIKIPLHARGSEKPFKTTGKGHEISLSIWQRLLFDLRFVSKHGFETVEALLQCGASPEFSISTEQDDTAYNCIDSFDAGIVFPSFQSEKLVTSYLLVTLPSSDGHKLKLSSRRRLPETLLTFIRRNGGYASLRDIIKLAQPPNEERLFCLIDSSARNEEEPILIAAKSHSSMAWVKLIAKSPIAPFVLGLLLMYLFSSFLSDR